MALPSSTAAAADNPRSVLDADVLRRFDVGDFLGKGSFGFVFVAIDRKTKAKVAIKVMLLEKLGKQGIEQTKSEIHVMSLLNHPRLVKLHEAFHSDKAIVMALDLVQGGELLKHLIALKHYSERTACLTMRNLLLAVKYMHDEGIVHRDLKPDNMLLVEKPNGPEQVTDIKVADFGFAAKYRGVPLVQPCGTPYYIAPEILEVALHKTRAHYDNMVDLWSIGVIGYILLSGSVPFNGQDKTRLFKAISRGEVSFAAAVWRDVSDTAKDFIVRLLQTDPLRRMTASQALAHRWIATAEVVPDAHLHSSQESLKEFDAKKKLRCAVFGIEATVRLMYLAGCDQNKMKPNSGIVELLTAQTDSRLQRLDLRNNYLGPAALDVLIQTLLKHSEVETIDLTNVILDDAGCDKILSSLETQAGRTGKVKRLILDDNPITHSCGRRLLVLLQKRIIHFVSVENTQMSKAIQRKISVQCALIAQSQGVQAPTAILQPAAAPPAIIKPAEALGGGLTRPSTGVTLPPVASRAPRTAPAAASLPPRR